MEIAEQHSPFRRFLRGAAAVVLGVITGAFLSVALQVGLYFNFPEEQASHLWGTFFWGDHWALRVAASLAAAVGAGYVAGLVARSRGRMVAMLSVIPSTLCWLALGILGFAGRVHFFSEELDVHVSIGNKLAASLLVLAMLPCAAWAGSAGEEAGILYAAQFDRRRHSILGIKWYHYLWLPFLAYLWISQASYALFYGLTFLKASWQMGMSLWAIVPMFFLALFYGAFALMGYGATKCYEVLAGLEPIERARDRIVAVLKYGVGALLLATIILGGVRYLHIALARWLSPN